MKLPLVFTLGIVAVSLPITISAQTIIDTTAPTLSGAVGVTASGSIASAGAYTFSTEDDLILGQGPIAETHGLLSDNSFNPGWSGANSTNTPTGNAAALANLTDGSFGDAVPSQGQFASAGANSGAGYTATYSLGSNVLGYNLTDLEVYSGWQDSGRYDQAYTIEYSLASNPSTYLTLATVNDYTTSATGPVGEMTELTPTSGLYLATGVANVEFVFNPNALGSWTGYRELVVGGSPVAETPEPSTWALLLGSLAALAIFARRRLLYV